MPILEELSYRARPGIQCRATTGLRVKPAMTSQLSSRALLHCAP